LTKAFSKNTLVLSLLTKIPSEDTLALSVLTKAFFEDTLVLSVLTKAFSEDTLVHSVLTKVPTDLIGVLHPLPLLVFFTNKLFYSIALVGVLHQQAFYSKTF